MNTFTRPALPICLAAAFSAMAILLGGCETESAASAQITVSPSSARLSARNPSVTLSASGGWNYTWSLSNSSYGSLSRASGSSVTYTASFFGGDSGSSNAVEQIVTVSAAGSSATNSASLSAKAVITQ